MAKVNSFLDKYEYLIFDMDGVITSEENYWDIAALTVYELLTSSTYYGKDKFMPQEALDNVKKIRAEVFSEDKMITLVKERGVNSNWDLGYIVFSYMLSGKFNSYREVYEHISKSSLMAFDLYNESGKFLSERLNLPLGECMRNEKMWNMCRNVFQEWYFGSDEYEVFYGVKPLCPNKPSMEMREVPAIKLDKVITTLSTLHSAGKKLLVATGRSDRDLSNPIKMWDIGKYFESDSLATYTYIEKAEAYFQQKGEKVLLTKPEPYIFLKALYKTNYDDEKIIKGDYDKSLLKKALVIGDAGSDIQAAKRMGSDFLAVLTGIAGEKGRAYFEKEKAEYILPDISHMITVD